MRGKTANEKLAGDIIELVKFCLSREITDEFKDMFKKSSANCESASASSQDSVRAQNCSEINKFIAMAENLDIKLTKLREDFDQSVSSLVNNSLASKSYSNDNALSQKSSNQLQKSQVEPHCADENENSNISETAKNQASTNGSESDHDFILR